ncbi:uncharacterized protein LOC111342604 [Stylophora pistillata]|uniref:uncharacterized protein LOC111342604 n=1 Tax=Stylophora pistillata TaxID=50429 RepID=UPI000C03CE5D|nr:uncharacterized protein LOC111342604 [Stylophora pistillata]XP_022805437.1 uncharacterized protein LOC111342604 [Stylophora pistillata]
MASQELPLNEASKQVHSRSKSTTSLVVPLPEEASDNEQILKALNDMYSPVLRLMKIFGSYYGQTNLRQLENMPTGKHIFSRMYCGLMMSFICFNVVTSASVIFNSGLAYTFLMYAVGHLLMLICGITSLVLLPLTRTKKSRFERFLRCLLTNVKSTNLNFVKKESRKALFITCFLSLFTIFFTFVCSEILGISISCCEPWSTWSGFRVFAFFSSLTGCAVWLLSTFFFCLTCIILVKCFDDFYQRMSSLPPLPIDFLSLKMEYHKLSEVVELADKMLAPTLFGIIAIFIPLLCISFYNTFILIEGTDPLTLVMNLNWCLVATTILAIALFFGSKVSEKIHTFQKTLQTLPISASEEGKVLMLLFDLYGEPKGLSIGGLVVITKSTSLTIVGVTVSYFAVMLSLPR